MAEKDKEAEAVEKEAESLDKLGKEVLKELLENHPKLTKAKALKLMKECW